MKFAWASATLCAMALTTSPFARADLAGPSLIGDWTGTFQTITGGAGNGTIGLDFLTSVPAAGGDDLTGTLSLFCSNSPAEPNCGFKPDFTAMFVSATDTVSITLTQNPTFGNTIVDLTGTLSADVDEISGTYVSVETNPVSGDFSVSRVVPEPATLALFGLGLAGIGLTRRRLARKTLIRPRASPNPPHRSFASSRSGKTQHRNYPISPMRTRFAFIAALCLVASTARATSILGEWSGSGTPVTIHPGGNDVDQHADLVFSSETPSGGGGFDLLGTADVTCVGLPPSDCGTGGVVDISGSLSPSGVLDFGTTANPDAFAGSYSGGNTITGVITSLNGDVYDWSLRRVAVPEPAALGLLSLGLAAMGLRRRWQQR